MADDSLAEGARNLALNCARLRRGESLLLICEDPKLGWYDGAAPAAVAGVAKSLGIDATLLRVEGPAARQPKAVEDAIARHDCTIFFARIGDQVRFDAPPQGTRSVMSYARTGAMLASAYGRASHGAFLALKEAVNAALLAAEVIEISCPLGSACRGRASDAMRALREDVALSRFPLGVPLPMEASEFSGRVALAGYLTPTGSQAYEPSSLKIQGTVFAQFTSGRITGFEGDAGQVARIEAHYGRVAGLFGIDKHAIHSWHAGIHPGCAYDRPMAEDPDRWSNTVFTNPRYLHFHTCGSYAPGEICWMLQNPSVSLDGKYLWQDGRLKPEDFPQTEKCLTDWPELTALFANPSTSVGLNE